MFGAATSGEDPFPQGPGLGEDNSDDELDALRHAYEAASAATTFDWRAGDLLVLDNYRFVHGRTAYAGDEGRRLGVMLGGAAEVEAVPLGLAAEAEELNQQQQHFCRWRVH